MNMKRFLMILAVSFATVGVYAQQKSLTLKDINIRDPYTLPFSRVGEDAYI